MSLDQTQSVQNAEQTLMASVLKSKQDKALAAWVLKEYTQAKTDRIQTERQWYTNLAFFFGKQYVQTLTQTSTGNFQLRTPAAPPWRVRLVVNKIRPMVRHEISRLSSQKPIFTVVPATTEDEDQSAARVGEQIFTAAYSDKKYAKVLRQALWWASICGTSFIKQYWNPRFIVSENEQNPVIGDIIPERVSPFHIYVPNLDEEELEKQPFIVHATVKPVEWVKDTYGIDATPTVRAENPVEDSFLNLVGAKNSNKYGVLCLEVWIKPGGHKDYPQGGLITLVGTEVVQNLKKFPYLTREYPFQKIDIIPTGKFYGDSNVTDMIPLQREYNRTKSQIVEAKNLMAKPKLIAPRGSVNPRQITSEPGQVILYTPGFTPPQPLPMDSLPPFVLQELDRLQQEMDDISGQHEITRGKNPSQVTAATAISYLQEQDDTKLAYAVASVEDAVEGLGKQYLQLVTQFWNTPRLVRIVGRDGAFEANYWAGNALKGNIDLRVQTGSALPQSKAAKQAFILDLMKLGVIPAETALDILDIGGIEKVYEDYLVDKRQSERENLKMSSIDPMLAVQLVSPKMDPMTGEVVMDPMTDQPMMPEPVLPPNTWDNHQAHIQIHNRFRKSQQFELLADPVKHIFEQHVLLHQIAISGTTPIMPDGTAGPDVQPGGTMSPDPQGSSQPPSPTS